MQIKTSTVRAAGGVVLRETAGKLDVLLIATHGSRRWSLPKGRLEAGENAETAAIREVREETGIQARILAPLETVEYFFFGHRHHRFHKFVDYFLMVYEEGVITPQYSEVDGAEWCAMPDALVQVTYPNDRKLVQQAVSLWHEFVPPTAEDS